MVNEGHISDYNTFSTEENEESDEDFGRFESKGESLLSLVQPELSSLAEYWLAALRDHALLMLPSGDYIIRYILFFIFIRRYMEYYYLRHCRIFEPTSQRWWCILYE